MSDAPFYRAGFQSRLAGDEVRRQRKKMAARNYHLEVTASVDQAPSEESKINSARIVDFSDKLRGFADLLQRLADQLKFLGRFVNAVGL